MIIFEIEYPEKPGRYSLNAIYSGMHWRKRQMNSHFWEQLVLYSLKKQGIKRKIFKEPVSIVMCWNDRFDIDNHAYMGKMIVDALRGYLIENDSRKFFKSITHEFHDGKNIKVIISDK